MVLKVREAGRVVNVHAGRCGGQGRGKREILGVDVTTAEDGAGWLTFLRSLTAPGLSGVALVTSDAHAGLVSAIGATLTGASWQRCGTHYATICWPSPEVVLVLGQDAAAFGIRSARRHIRWGAI